MTRQEGPISSRHSMPLKALPGVDIDPPSVGNRLVYAIGDVHGRVDLLRELLAGILEDVLRTHPANRPMIIFLGDYVDRGPESPAVIDLLVSLKAEDSLEVRTLRGNHEQVFIDALERGEIVPDWLKFGGAATLAAYGVKFKVSSTVGVGAMTAARRLAKAVPSGHYEFLTSTEHFISVGDYAFCHAGIDPAKPLTAQVVEDLLWIREAFTASDIAGPKIIVHGHTETEEVVVNPVRIGLDTSAYASGRLTALRLYETTRHILQTGRQVAA